MQGVAGLISLFIEALIVLVIISVLGSWVPSLRRAALFRGIDQIVEPMLAPFRRILPPQNLGGLDLSPLFLIIVLQIIQRLVVQFVLQLGF
ncbi:MAG: YggT family protein [Armatimonadota bacterium]|nr:YggT family protein [Armatimonadota bacterium]